MTNDQFETLETYLQDFKLSVEKINTDRTNEELDNIYKVLDKQTKVLESIHLFLTEYGR